MTGTFIDPTGQPTLPRDGEAVRRSDEALSRSVSILHVGANPPVGGSGTAAGTRVPPWKRWFDTTNMLDKIWNGSVWITLTPVSARVDAACTRTLGTYGAPQTGAAGPAVTVATGTAANVWVSSVGDCSNDFPAIAPAFSVAVSGASAIAAGAAGTPEGIIYSEAGFNVEEMCAHGYISNLTAGVNIFTFNYRGDGANVSDFDRRIITVQAIPTL